MIRARTTLILGAGASAHLGFPTAEGLRRRILKTSDYHTNYKLAGSPDAPWGFENATWAEFSARFRRCGDPSIDLFLSSNPQFEALGKQLIAASLINLENEARLFHHIEGEKDENGQPHVNWYEDLFQAMRPDETGGFVTNRLRIITFNYDRSLEHYLANAIANSNIAADYEAALKLLYKLPILHVHGQLGSLQSDSPEYREYSVAGDQTTFKRVARAY